MDGTLRLSPHAPRVLVCCGAAAHHIALAAQLHADWELVGLVIEQRKPRPQPLPSRLRSFIDRAMSRLMARPLNAAWASMLNDYRRRFAAPTTAILRCSSINSADVLAFVRNLKPDLVVISGTSLVKPPLLELSLPLGMINLHTGLSPYMKGGPNCTNWCLAEGCPELIGSTVMWIDAGIDTGEILASGRPDLSRVNSLASLHMTVMQHAHEMLRRTVVALVRSGRTAVQALPQDELGQGRTYYTREWTWRRRRAAVRAFERGELASIPRRPAPRVVTPRD